MKIMLASVIAGVSLLSLAPAHAATYQTVVEGFARDIQGVVDATPQCPAGFTPISGGWNVGDPNRVLFSGRRPENNINESMNLGRFAVVGSYPNGNGWRTYGYVNGAAIVNIYTVCASP
ncbi:hypothetical protein LN565_09130 [Xanthomonas euvesicatoria pv. euvesicatoria]|uniref:Uncharacterized protein n=5 Tax=Xanthomonas euvesicatoria TaxID=456327 RepID=A0A6B3KLP6_XANEU|nr:hypothetical protein [Xanthomonas euvesicatoria]MBV6791142.1 hypothetical protein [Xanthomonas campestris pv. clerodendri]MBV6831407.1 hypothetical protein [Xanthomonas campestris pv. viegasii]MCC8504490.1 hypothetical protein [Xanthomonas euvesicatoria pv. euvesicatoria]MCC8515081.1 hypothetical protein [Xanthomonas euvesicatoria pv. euvesicatoria]MCC8544634.1 hypothetical protein [Xanthomonas euvesicatoria pv. euvesicatoria]